MDIMGYFSVGVDWISNFRLGELGWIIIMLVFISVFIVDMIYILTERLTWFGLMRLVAYILVGLVLLGKVSYESCIHRIEWDRDYYEYSLEMTEESYCEGKLRGAL